MSIFYNSIQIKSTPFFESCPVDGLCGCQLTLQFSSIHGTRVRLFTIPFLRGTSGGWVMRLSYYNSIPFHSRCLHVHIHDKAAFGLAMLDVWSLEFSSTFSSTLSCLCLSYNVDRAGAHLEYSAALEQNYRASLHLHKIIATTLFTSRLRAPLRM